MGIDPAPHALCGVPGLPARDDGLLLIRNLLTSNSLLSWIQLVNQVGAHAQDTEPLPVHRRTPVREIVPEFGDGGGQTDAGVELPIIEDPIEQLHEDCPAVAGLLPDGHLQRGEGVHPGDYVKRVNEPRVECQVPADLEVAPHLVGDASVQRDLINHGIDGFDASRRHCAGGISTVNAVLVPLVGLVDVRQSLQSFHAPS